MIPFTNRFHGHNSLSFVYKNGRAVRSRHATIKFTSNPHRDNTRIAVVISKKVLKSAVKRNRVRRRIYEYMRSQLPKIQGVHDIVVVVSSAELFGIPSAELTAEFDDLMTQANLYKTSKN
ncbi:MAG TPA: ribonuclease P protein component [Candidatus Saccharibacteria bacterium]|nr:ribonuclease P protein component [Candidatus Saccharibacteria bacterium]HRQ98091.1 ribonuclease P protein component [Candidatus Saccharibacteria bacterium]